MIYHMIVLDNEKLFFLNFLFYFFLSHVLPMLSFFQTRSIKQTTVFRGPLEIGSQLKINVYGYNRVKKRYFIIIVIFFNDNLSMWPAFGYD